MRWLTIALLLWGGCGSPCQQIKATRCTGNIVEACGSNKKWQRVMDCAAIKPTTAPNAPKVWKCAEVPGKGSKCMPEVGE